MGKIVFSKGFIWLMVKVPVFGRGFFDSYLSLADWDNSYAIGISFVLFELWEFGA
jgi:hypothetical protein